jgi:hypothetical protein
MIVFSPHSGILQVKCGSVFPRSDKKEEELQVASPMLSCGRVILQGRSEESDLEGEARLDKRI